MAFCNNCGAKLPEGARFCVKCGTAVVQIPKTDENGGGRKKPERGRVLLIILAGLLLAGAAVWLIFFSGVFGAEKDGPGILGCYPGEDGLAHVLYLNGDTETLEVECDSFDAFDGGFVFRKDRTLTWRDRKLKKETVLSENCDSYSAGDALFLEEEGKTRILRSVKDDAVTVDFTVREMLKDIDGNRLLLTAENEIWRLEKDSCQPEFVAAPEGAADVKLYTLSPTGVFLYGALDPDGSVSICSCREGKTEKLLSGSDLMPEYTEPGFALYMPMVSQSRYCDLAVLQCMNGNRLVTVRDGEILVTAVGGENAQLSYGIVSESGEDVFAVKEQEGLYCVTYPDYFSEAEEDGSTIWYLPLNGKPESVVTAAESDFGIADGRLFYFREEGELVCTEVKGAETGETAVVGEGIQDFTVSDGRLFYITDAHYAEGGEEDDIGEASLRSWDPETEISVLLDPEAYCDYYKYESEYFSMENAYLRTGPVIGDVCYSFRNYQKDPSFLRSTFTLTRISADGNEREEVAEKVLETGLRYGDDFLSAECDTGKIRNGRLLVDVVYFGESENGDRITAVLKDVFSDQTYLPSGEELPAEEIPELPPEDPEPLEILPEEPVQEIAEDTDAGGYVLDYWSETFQTGFLLMPETTPDGMTVYPIHLGGLNLYELDPFRIGIDTLDGSSVFVMSPVTNCIGVTATVKVMPVGSYEKDCAFYTLTGDKEIDKICEVTDGFEVNTDNSFTLLFTDGPHTLTGFGFDFLYPSDGFYVSYTLEDLYFGSAEDAFMFLLDNGF